MDDKNQVYSLANKTREEIRFASASGLLVRQEGTGDIQIVMPNQATANVLLQKIFEEKAEIKDPANARWFVVRRSPSQGNHYVVQFPFQAARHFGLWPDEVNMENLPKQIDAEKNPQEIYDARPYIPYIPRDSDPVPEQQDRAAEIAALQQTVRASAGRKPAADDKRDFSHVEQHTAKKGFLGRLFGR